MLAEPATVLQLIDNVSVPGTYSTIINAIAIMIIIMVHSLSLR